MCVLGTVNYVKGKSYLASLMKMLIFAPLSPRKHWLFLESMSQYFLKEENVIGLCFKTVAFISSIQADIHATSTSKVAWQLIL